MKSSIKVISLVLSAFLCLGLFTQYSITEVSADIGGANSDYALSLMGQYATITSGDFENGSWSNHSMAPVAVGGDYVSTMFQLTDNRDVKFFRDLQYDLVIGGKITNKTVSVGLNSQNGLNDYEFAVVEGNITADQFVNSYNFDKSVVKTYTAENLPVNFDSFKLGMNELSKSIDDFAKNDSSAIQVTANGGTLNLVGTGEFNVFNVSSSNFNDIVLNVPKNSHSIINIPGATGYHSVAMNYISNVKEVNGTLTFDSTPAVELNDMGEDSILKTDVRYLNQNVIINAAYATEIGDFRNGTVIAPNAVMNTSSGNTNGGYFVKEFYSTSGIEFHGGNIGGSFTWVKKIVSVKCDVAISKDGIGGAYDNKDIPGAELTLSGVDFSGKAIDMNTIIMSLGVTATEVSKTSAAITWVSGTTASVAQGLPEGVYTIHENKAPEGYNLTDDVYFTVKSGNVYGSANIDDSCKLTDNVMVMYDKAFTDIKVSKEAAGGEYDGKELPGATLTLTVNELEDQNLKFAFTTSSIDLGENAVLVSTAANKITWISGTTPTYIKGLANGTYTLTEELAPIGYDYASDMTFTIVNGNVETVTMYDKVSPIPEEPEEIIPEETTVPTTVETTPAPTTVETTTVPTTVETTPAPTTVETTTVPTTVETTPAPTTVETTVASVVIETTVEETTVPTTVETTPAPTTVETTVETTPAPTTVETTTVPTTVETTPAPTTVTTVETTVPTTVETTEEIVPVKPTPVAPVEPEKIVEDPISTTTTITQVVEVIVVPEVIPPVTPDEEVKIETIVTAIDKPEVEEIVVDTTVVEEITTPVIEYVEVTPAPKADSVVVDETPIASSVSVPEEVKTSSSVSTDTSITSTGESQSTATICGISALIIASMIAGAEYVYNKKSRKDYTK